VIILLQNQIRKAIMGRYALLPYWYTLFHEAFLSGVPTMRPLWMEYPSDPETFGMDDQWLVGADLLVKPVTEKGVVKTSVYLPGSPTRVPALGSPLFLTPARQAISRGTTWSPSARTPRPAA
jgi:hypothetical protein